MNYFYGVFFIILGVLVLIHYIFKLNLPVFKIGLGILFVFLGISLFINNPGSKSDTDIVFGKKTIQVTALEKEYNVVFAEGTIDFSKVIPQSKGEKVRINSIFSKTTVIINPSIPVLVKSNSAFAVTGLPDQSSINFGNHKYMTNNLKPELPHLEIESKVAFSKLSVVDNQVKQK